MHIKMTSETHIVISIRVNLYKVWMVHFAGNFSIKQYSLLDSFADKVQFIQVLIETNPFE